MATLNLWDVADGARKLREKRGPMAPLALLTPRQPDPAEVSALRDIGIEIQVCKWLAPGTGFLKAMDDEAKALALGPRITSDRE